MRRIHGSSSTIRIRSAIASHMVRARTPWVNHRPSAPSHGMHALDSRRAALNATAMLTTFFTEEHEIFRKTLRDFVAKELAPHTTEWEEKKEFPASVFKRCGEL